MSKMHRRPESKIASPLVQTRIADLAESGASLSQIRAHLAEPEPEGFGLDVSRTSIYKRLQAAGIKLKNESIAAKAMAPSFTPEALALSRREISAEDLARHKEPRRGRTESWLTHFAKEISGLIEDGFTYRGIWDLMAQRYPVVPQFAEALTDKQKTDRLAVFIRRQRNKQESKSKGRRPLQRASTRVLDSSISTAPIAASPRTPEQDTSAPVRPTRARASIEGTRSISERRQAQAQQADEVRADVSHEQLADMRARHGLPKSK